MWHVQIASGACGTVLTVPLDDLPGWLSAWCVDQLGDEPVGVLFGRTDRRLSGCPVQSRLPQTAVRVLLGAIALALAVVYLVPSVSSTAGMAR